MPSEAIIAVGIYVLGLIVIPPILGFFVDARNWDDSDRTMFAFVVVVVWPLLALAFTVVFVVLPLWWLFKMMLNGGSKARKRYDDWRIERAKKVLEKKQKEKED
jgi:uncharacterized membrane protein YdbT with pleckstrin-like domain